MSKRQKCQRDKYAIEAEMSKRQTCERDRHVIETDGNVTVIKPLTN